MTKEISLCIVLDSIIASNILSLLLLFIRRCSVHICSHPWEVSTCYCSTCWLLPWATQYDGQNTQVCKWSQGVVYLLLPAKYEQKRTHSDEAQAGSEKGSVRWCEWSKEESRPFEEKMNDYRTFWRIDLTWYTETYWNKIDFYYSWLMIFYSLAFVSAYLVFGYHFHLAQVVPAPV